MTARERAERAARACTRGRASPKNIALIEQEIVAAEADAANEATESALDEVYSVHLAVEKAVLRLKARIRR